MDEESFRENEGNSIRINKDDHVFEVVGDIKSRLGVLLRANRNPKIEIFDFFIDFSRRKWLPITFFVDDITPKLLEGRYQEHQNNINLLYVNYLESRGVDYKFASIDFPEINNYSLNDFFRTISNVNIGDINLILPEKKRQNLDNLTLDEFIHYFIETSIVQKVSRTPITFVIWKISSWLYYHYNDKHKEKINFIIFNNNFYKHG